MQRHRIRRAGAKIAGACLVALATGLQPAGAASPSLVVARCCARADDTGSASRLESALDRYLGHRAGRVSVGITDAATGDRVLIHSHRPQLTASVVKVEILEALLARHHAPLPDLRRAQARRMIEHSSNADAEALWNVVGRAAGLRRFGHRAGLVATRPAAGRGPGYAWGLTLTTPADQLRLLQLLLSRSRLLTGRDRAFALHLLRHVESDQRWGVTAGTSSPSYVAVKNGWLPLRGDAGDWQVNSVGDVTAPHHCYQIAVMSTRDPTMAYGIATIARVSRIVWRLTGAHGC